MLSCAHNRSAVAGRLVSAVPEHNVSRPLKLIMKIEQWITIKLCFFFLDTANLLVLVYAQQLRKCLIVYIEIKITCKNIEWIILNDIKRLLFTMKLLQISVTNPSILITTRSMMRNHLYLEHLNCLNHVLLGIVYRINYISRFLWRKCDCFLSLGKVFRCLNHNNKHTTSSQYYTLIPFPFPPHMLVYRSLLSLKTEFNREKKVNVGGMFDQSALTTHSNF